MIQKITPFLWFNNNLEEAMNLYISIFENSKVVSIQRYGEGSGDLKGTAMTGTFQLEGQQFMALNGGPMFTFSPAISFFVNCETQEEIDKLWEALSEGGEKQRCGWLKDKFGVSWQIIPSILGELLYNNDPKKAKKVMDAMLKMEKMDIRKLKEAAI